MDDIRLKPKCFVMDNQQPSLETERFNDHPLMGVGRKRLAFEVAHIQDYMDEDMICSVWKHTGVFLPL